MTVTTGLLVSVRDAAEAAEAFAAGADLIDVKEPLGGSLGAASPEVVARVVRAVAGRRAVSVALGELTEQSSADAVVELPKLAGGVQFAKLGLAGCSAVPNWREKWRQLLGDLPTATAAVAVIYADWAAAAAPPPDAILAAARQAGCRAVLVDTFDKRGPGLMKLWSLDDLRIIVRRGREAGMRVVFGGQLRAEHFPQLLPLEPDFLAVRGAACRGERTARIDPQLVRNLRAAIARPECSCR